MSECIEKLQNRAADVARNTVRQSVKLDHLTFDKIVQFIEAEGCSLQEGLRRAVRMGVEALLLDRSPSETVEAPYAPSPLPGYYLGQTPLPYVPTIETEDEDVSEFVRNAPPGLA